MTNSIKAMLAGAPVAIASDLAHDLMSIELPDAAMHQDQRAAASVERFTVTRGIAVLPVRGLLTPNSEILERYLGWSTYFGLTEAVAELSERGDVTAIVLDVNSPGGTVVGCEGAAEAIAEAAKNKPVHAIASPMAASAAYWLASQAHSIAVMPGGIVGSIGVAMMASSVVGPDSYGEQRYLLTSSHARAKRPDPGTEEGMAELRRSLDEAEGQFHAAVSRGRGIAPDVLLGQLSVTDDDRDGGAVFAGQQAIERGLADSIETRAAFYARMIEAYGASGSSAPSVRYRARAEAAAALARI